MNGRLLRSNRLIGAICLSSVLWLNGCLVPPVTPRSAASTETPPAASVPPTTESDYVPAPDLAQDFTLQSISGETVTLRELQGRWVILNFWATWCTPCREEMPYLQQLAGTAPDQIVVLGINMREDAAEIQPFLNEVGITFPILLDPTDEMLIWYGPRGLPLTYLIAPDSTVVYRRYGQLEPESLNAQLADLGVLPQ